MFDFIGDFVKNSINQEKKMAAQALLEKYEEALVAFHEDIAPDKVEAKRAINWAHQYPQNILRALKAIANGRRTYETYIVEGGEGFSVKRTRTRSGRFRSKNYYYIREMSKKEYSLKAIKSFISDEFFCLLIDACYYDKPQQRRKLYQLHSDLSRLIGPRFVQDMQNSVQEEELVFTVDEDALNGVNFSISFPTFAMQHAFLKKIGGESEFEHSVLDADVNGYDFVPMSELPADQIPEPNKLYVELYEAFGSTIQYVLLAPNGAIIKGCIIEDDIREDESDGTFLFPAHLNLNDLKFKQGMMNIISARERITVNFPVRHKKPYLNDNLFSVSRTITFAAYLHQDGMLRLLFPSVKVREVFLKVLGISKLGACDFLSNSPAFLMKIKRDGSIIIVPRSWPSPKTLQDITVKKDALHANYGLLLNQLVEQRDFLTELRQDEQEISEHLLNKSEYRQPFSVIMSYLANGDERHQERQEIAYDWADRIRKGKIQKTDEMVSAVGGFSGCLGMHGQRINNPDKEGGGFLVKQLLNALNPASGWETSNLTRLNQPLHFQEGQIAISTEGNFYAKEAFGEGGCTIDRGRLAKLSNSARICTLSDLIPKALFLKIQNELWPYLKEQEQRTLGEILGELGIYERFRDECCAMGLFSPERFGGFW